MIQLRSIYSLMLCLLLCLLWLAPVVLAAQYEQGDIGPKSLGPIDGSREIFSIDEFLGMNITSGQIGALGCTAALISPATPAIRPGLIQLSTGATINSLCSLILHFTPGIASAQLSQNQQCFGFRNTTTTSVIIRVGIQDDLAGIADPPNAGGWLEYDSSLGDTTWFFVTRNGGISTRTNLNKPYVSNTFYYFCIEGTGQENIARVRWNTKTSGETWTFSDETVIGLSIDWAPTFQIKNLSASSRAIHVDFFSLYAKQAIGRSSN